MNDIARWSSLIVLVAGLAVGCGDDGGSGPDATPDATPDGAPDGAADAEPDGGDGSVDGMVDAGGPCVTVRTIEGATASAPGPDGIAGNMDLEVQNGLLRTVFNAVDRPAFLAASGGHIVDFHYLGESDHFQELSQLGGPAQSLQVAYTELTIAEQDDNRVVIRASGHVMPQPNDDGTSSLDPDPGTGLTMITDYEIVCDDPRVRIDSTLENTTSDLFVISNGFGVLDFFVWGGSSALPFCPVTGMGDECLEFSSESPLATLVRSGYVGSTGSLVGDPASFAYYPVSFDVITGVHGQQLSTFGDFAIGIGLLMAGDVKRYERVLVAGHESDVASAVDIVLDDLAALGRGDVGTVTGSVAVPDGETLSADRHERPTIVFAVPPETGDATDPTTWQPATIARVQADGTFSARVPAGKISYEIRAPGRVPQRGTAPDVGADATVDLGALALAATPVLNVSVSDGTSGIPSRIVVVGTGGTATPSFGSPFGPSPAGNTAHTDGDGMVSLNIPVGTYDVYATHGMNYSVARQAVTIDATGADVNFSITELDVIGAGFITADFHVHSAASFDSSVPIGDRVLSFLAEGVQAIVATEHDVVFDYGPAAAALDASMPATWQGRVRTFVGLESTAFVPYADFPHTIGHTNAFPLDVVAGAHKNGAPQDEFQAPGTLFETLRGLASPVTPLLQLNHGRSTRNGSIWLGYFDSCGFDPTMAFDETHSCFAATGPGGTRAWDIDATEVINGKDPFNFINMQRDWLALLRTAPNGRLPVATANSDSHRLVSEEAGYPLNFLRSDVALDALDDAALVAEIEDGGVAGGLGVFVWFEVCQADGSGCVAPGRTPLAATPGDDLQIKVRVAAPPWVPVEEVRVRMGGTVVATLSGADLATPTDPFGTADTVRYDDTIVVPCVAGDSFVTVDAGFALPRVGDLDGDGVAETTDNDGDGDVDADDAAIGGIVVADPSGVLSIIVPGARAMGFANPVLIDSDGTAGYDATGTPLVD